MKLKNHTEYIYPNLTHRFVVDLDGIPKSLIKGFSNPECYYEDKKLKWKPITIELYSFSNPSAEKIVLKALDNWVHLNEGYIPAFLVENISTSGEPNSVLDMSHSKLVSVDFGVYNWSVTELRLIKIVVQPNTVKVL